MARSARRRLCGSPAPARVKADAGARTGSGDQRLEPLVGYTHTSYQDGWARDLLSAHRLQLESGL